MTTIIDASFIENEKNRIIDNINQAHRRLFKELNVLGAAVDYPESSDYILNYISAVCEIINKYEDALYKEQAAARRLQEEETSAPHYYVEDLKNIIK